MNESDKCYVCDRPANNLFEGTARWSFGKGFCSQGCKNSHRGDYIGWTGFVIGVSGLIMLISSNNPVMILFFILGLGFIVYGAYLKNDALDRKVRPSQTISGGQTSGPIPFDPQDQLIYSSILKTKVHPCCHQSARLNDQYCACGRVIE
ncbi:MAG: hypothetical protein GPJ54_15470, partial [Candidatus Heimdallarchaeota archaeon]|nr:hypothetical protein [Candidatus Heimdallarchaeota archaeon]